MDWIASVLVRGGECAVEASPTFLCGLIVAGVMRCMLGVDGVSKLFGGNGWRGLLRAWGVGMLLPVCSLGVIPIAREMRRCGISGATILAFVLAAPHVNPLSLLYGLTLSTPVVILIFASASLALAIFSGALWDFCFRQPNDDLPGDTIQTPPPGLGRLASVFLSAARESVHYSSLYILLAILFNGLMAGSLPHGSLSLTMRHDDWRSPALMGLLATPMYSGPLQGMMRLGLMFEHGNSVGAAFVLFELGIGVNIGILIWLAIDRGLKRMALWLGIVVLTAVILGYASEAPLYFAHEEASHTHAFDDWTSPFAHGMNPDIGQIFSRIGSKCGVLESVSLLMLMSLITLGSICTLFDSQRRLDTFLARMPSTTGKLSGAMAVNVPPRVLGFVALGGLFAFSVVGLYLYYPNSYEAFEDMTRIKADAMGAVRYGNREEAIRQLEAMDLLTRKLQVGIFLRQWRLDPAVAKTAEDLRERLEEIRDNLIAENKEAAVTGIILAEQAFRSLRAACADSLDSKAAS